MSRRRNVKARMTMLNDLRDVLDSMRTLALVEISKLSRTEPQRRRLQTDLGAIATATSGYYPAFASAPPRRLFLLVGSERGFCAGFNDDVIMRWARIRASDPDARAIVVGSVLSEKLDASNLILVRLEGAVIAEDIDDTLVAVLREISSAQEAASSPIALSSVANGRDGVEVTGILPFAPQRAPSERMPELNLPPEAFVRAFLDQYADAALHGVFATSLLSENRARLAHMTTAIDRLDDNMAALRRQAHRLRQEEITQEVEAILLSTQAEA